MTITMFKAKSHRLRVREEVLYYEGSITVDKERPEASELLNLAGRDEASQRVQYEALAA